MKKIYNTITQTFLPTYPRDDDEPIVGLDPTLEVYEVVEEPPPEIAENQYLERVEELDHVNKTLTMGWRTHETPVVAPVVITPVVVPITVPFRSLAFALRDAGLYQQVKAAALSSEDGEIWWYTAQSSTVSRDHPFVEQLRIALDKTTEEIDAVFNTAAAFIP
jgi:hypothetical protein